MITEEERVNCDLFAETVLMLFKWLTIVIQYEDQGQGDVLTKFIIFLIKQWLWAVLLN